MSDTHLAVFPGTFDPLTLGHFDIIKRAAKIFDRVLIAVANSPGKHTLLSLEDRVRAAREICRDFDNATAEGFTGLLVDFLKKKQATILVRGVRTVADYDYEVQLAGMYRTMMPEMDIVMLPTSGNLAFISSTLVREIIVHHGDISKFVPPAVNQMIRARYLLNLPQDPPIARAHN